MSTTENPDALWRPDEVATAWRQSVATVYRKIARGSIRAYRLGDGHGPLRIPASEVRRHLRDRAPAGASIGASRVAAVAGGEVVAPPASHPLRRETHGE